MILLLKSKSLLDRIRSWLNFVGTPNFLTKILLVCDFQKSENPYRKLLRYSNKIHSESLMPHKILLT